MTNDLLFEGADEAAAVSGVPKAPARYRVAQRDQTILLPSHLDALLPTEHRARLVWDFVCGLDLSAFYDRIRAVEGHAGRPPIDPRILLALWLFATAEGVGSARALARLCEEHIAYRWICGGVSMNPHTLADFRTGHGEALDALLSQSLAGLMTEGLLTLERVAQDGMRVRASAGAASFRRKETLEQCLEEAEEHVRELRKELEEDPQGTTRRQAAARERAALDRAERVRRAIEQREEAAQKKTSEKEKEQTRASTTDPECRVMKMADGGFRPAYNAQLATDTQSQLIVGVEVTNLGSDYGEMPPMVEQVEQRLGARPRAMLVDGGFASRTSIGTVSDMGTAVYAPVMKNKGSRAPDEARPNDTPAIAQWRERMGTAQAQEIYKERAATAECVNALARNRGLRQFLVRGASKVRSVLLLHALTHNMLRAPGLRVARGALAAA